MGDLISRQNAIKGVKELFACADIGNDEYDITYMLENLPSADRPTGEWVKKVLLKDTVYDLHVYKCSCCGVWGKLKFNYCPNCGAKMRGEEE